MVAALIGALVAYLAMRAQSRSARQRATLDFIRELAVDSEYQEARKSFLTARDDPKSLREIAEGSPDQAAHFRYLYNTHELMAIGIKENILDDNLYHRWYRSTVINDCAVAQEQNLFDYERSKKCKNHACGKPCASPQENGDCGFNCAIFKEFEDLAARWAKHKQPSFYPPKSWAGRWAKFCAWFKLNLVHIVAYTVFLAIICILMFRVLSF